MTLNSISLYAPTQAEDILFKSRTTNGLDNLHNTQYLRKKMSLLVQRVKLGHDYCLKRKNTPQKQTLCMPTLCYLKYRAMNNSESYKTNGVTLLPV